MCYTGKITAKGELKSREDRGRRRTSKSFPPREVHLLKLDPHSDLVDDDRRPIPIGHVLDTYQTKDPQLAKYLEKEEIDSWMGRLSPTLRMTHCPQKSVRPTRLFPLLNSSSLLPQPPLLAQPVFFTLLASSFPFIPLLYLHGLLLSLNSSCSLSWPPFCLEPYFTLLWFPLLSTPYSWIRFGNETTIFLSIHKKPEVIKHESDFSASFGNIDYTKPDVRLITTIIQSIFSSSALNPHGVEVVVSFSLLSPFSSGFYAVILSTPLSLPRHSLQSCVANTRHRELYRHKGNLQFSFPFH
ncbi:hypothetical protein VNO78_16068 [Psophocarpus tetragonolobus]|uniref:Uncharacterized protein n=1 Tax=Psophocarpus tetragonolobus TaxID=3891 RepID=A0AAN9SH64_PSOTE